MSGMEAYFDATAGAMHRVLGAEDLELRRPVRLRGPRQQPALALELAAPAAAGASSVLLQLPGGAVLRGSVPAGAALALGAEELEVAADADAAGEQVELQLSAPLAGAHAAGAPAVLAPTVTFTLLDCMTYRVVEELVPGELTGRVSFGASVPRAGAPTEPRLSDVLTSSRYGTGTVLQAPGDGGGSWELLAGRDSQAGRGDQGAAA